MDDHFEEDPQQYKTTGVAARMGDLVGLQQMVWNGRPVDVFDNRGWSPLHEAAYKGFSGCLEFLLRQAEVDPNWQTHRNETAGLLAARHGHCQCLRALVNAQADINLTTTEGFSPLFEAVQAKSNDCIRLLVKKGANVNHAVYTGYTPLHQAASMGSPMITGYLLQQGAQQDLQCSSGLTPLFLAVQSGNIDTVRVLLRHAQSCDGVDEDIVNMAAEDGATPLLIAAQEGYADIVDMLLDHGADANIQVTDTKAGPLQYAVYCGHSKCVRKLIPVTDMLMFESDYGVMHPLVQALKLPTTDILQQLLAAGLSPSGVRTLEQDQVDELQELSDGFVETGCKASLLCHVPSDAPLEATQFLLERGMSPNADQLNGVSELSPLVAAMMRGNLPLFCLLLKHGAKPNVYSARGNVSMVYALHRDLQHRGNVADGTAKANTKTLDSSLSENGAASCLWLNQAKHSFFLRLWAAGGEVQSLLQDPSTGEAGRWQLASVIQTNLCEGSQQDSSRLQRSRAQVMALLALLLCLSRNVVSLPDSLLQLVSPDQAKQLASLAGKSDTLAQLCRQHIFRRLCCQKDRLEKVVATLGLPQTLGDYLLFSELEPYSQTLGTLLRPVLE